jgi:8-oxo-dGTP pyrophosphatase MutT (NUDIX family)
MALDLADGIIKNVRAIIKKEGTTGPLFLLTQEPSGEFTIPGGCKDAEDADLLTALHRELKEELYLDPTDYSAQATDIRKEYEHLYNTPPERAGKNTVISLFLVSNLTKEPRASAEIKDIVWVTAEDALRMLKAPHMNELFRMSVFTPVIGYGKRFKTSSRNVMALSVHSSSKMRR